MTVTSKRRNPYSLLTPPRTERARARLSEDEREYLYLPGVTILARIIVPKSYTVKRSRLLVARLNESFSGSAFGAQIRTLTLSLKLRKAKVKVGIIDRDLKN